MKKKLFLFSCLLFIGRAQAQLLIISAGTSLTIQGGAVLSVDNLTLTPSTDFSLTNTTLIKSATVFHTTSNPYISRVYQFTNSTNPFNGSIQINYNDGAELNGIPEAQLTLNVHNGTNWTAYPAATRDATNNFVLTIGISSVALNELTLADFSTPLPLVWLSFTATKQNQTSLVKWSTSQEQNTRNFTIQHSVNGINWTSISTLPAAGNSSSTINYSYVHTTPVTGINYYRILQTDLDNRNSYSIIRTLKFTISDEPFIIIGNPVTNNVLTVQVNTVTILAFYTADGKLLWREPVNAGTKNIDVSRYARGAYLLKANTTTQKIVIR
ncbi:MAG TPA: T9SS type A sorting domain-containing protein [Chitinophagaceae bacterium]